MDLPIFISVGHGSNWFLSKVLMSGKLRLQIECLTQLLHVPLNVPILCSQTFSIGRRANFSAVQCKFQRPPQDKAVV